MVLAISWALLWRLHTSSDVTDSSVNIRRATTRQEYEGQVQSLARAAYASRLHGGPFFFQQTAHVTTCSSVGSRTANAAVTQGQQDTVIEAIALGILSP